MPEDMGDPQAWRHSGEGGCPNEGVSPACWVHQRYLWANKAIASGLLWKVLLLGRSVPVAQNSPGGHG